MHQLGVTHARFPMFLFFPIDGMIDIYGSRNEFRS